MVDCQKDKQGAMSMHLSFWEKEPWLALDPTMSYMTPIEINDKTL
jgi:hypothetical protein